MKRFLSFLMAVVFGITSAFATTVYCKMTYSWWTQDDAAVAVHYWGGTSTGTSWPGVRMTAVTGEDGMWSADVPADVEGLMFVRVNGGSGSVSDWGAKTANLTLPTDDKNLYTITSSSATWGDPGVAGEWSKYEASGSGSGGDDPVTPPTPALYDTLYFVNTLGWATPYGYYWPIEVSNWPGQELKKTEDKVGNYDVYMFVAPVEKISNCLFNDGASENTKQTVDLAPINNDKYFVPSNEQDNVGAYKGTWYATLDAITGEQLAAGFYLIGQKGWTVADLSEDLKFAETTTANVYSLTVTLAKDQEIKAVYVNDKGEIANWMPNGDNFVVTDKYAGEKTVLLNVTGKGGEGWFEGYLYVEPNPDQPTLADGFYLVGSMTGWAPKEGYLFAANPDNEGEYMITATLAADDAFKVVKVENGAYSNDSWYPGEGGDYVVDAAHAGEKAIYFRPDYQGGEDWYYGCIYIAPNEDQPVAEWAEIIFTAATAADATAKPFNDSVFTVAGSTFSMKCSDAQGKMAVDANNATFGTKADGNTKYTLRLKTMGKTGSSNFMTLTIPADGILRFAALPGGTSDERTVVMKQGDDEIYNQVITSNKNEDNYYDYRTVNVKQGTLTLTYPVNGINFYSFAFKAGSTEPEQPAEDEREKREIVLVPGEIKAADPAMFLMAWTAGKEGFTTKMDVKEVEGDTLYVAQMPKELDSLIFVRCATGAASIEWGVNVWNQSTDQKIACDTATFAGWNDAMFNVTWCAAEPEQPTIADGFYLVGTFNSWTPAEGYLFAANPDNEGEYMLTANLAEKDEFKAVKVENGKYGDGSWYPGEGGNYVVDAAHAGEKTIYFRPEGNTEWGGCFYIAPNEAPEMTVIYDWAGEIGATIFGGNSGITTGTVKIHKNTDNVNGIKFGSSYVYADGKWIAIKPAEGGFKAGDVLSVSVVFNNSDATKYCMVDLRAADGDTRIWMSDSLSTLNGRNEGEPIVQTYTLEADQDSLFLGRYGNTGMFVTLLKVERAAGGDTPAPEPTYYLKNNWEGAQDWTWKAMTKEDGYYSLANVVFGGTGVNISNDPENDGDPKFIEAKDIETFDAGFNPAQLGALDTVVFFFDPEAVNQYTGANGLTAQIIGKYVEPVNPPTPSVIYSVAGSKELLGADWNEKEGNEMTLDAADGLYKLVKTEVTLAAGTKYEFKVVTDHDWTKPSYPSANKELYVDQDGKYDVTITFNAETQEVNAVAEFKGGAVVEKHYLIVGDADVAKGKNWDNDAAENLMTSADEGLTYTLVVEKVQLLQNKLYGYKVVEKGSWTEYYPNTGDNAYFSVEESAIYTITYTYTVKTSQCAVVITKSGEMPEPTLANGLYLVGTFNGVSAWTIDDLSAEKMFKATDEEGQYSIDVTLAENDEFKAVYVEADAIQIWYPSEGGNYVVDANHAGQKTIYFRPVFWADWNGHFYVAPNEGPAPEPTYYLKNNWEGAQDWTWKAMTKEDGYYSLANVVFGGMGVNISTDPNEEAPKFIEMKDIETFDADYNPAQLGALDTVVFFFDPEMVNQYTGENGLTAQIIGKYVEPVVPPTPDPTVVVIGDMNQWDETNPIAFTLSQDKKTASLVVPKIPVGDYNFKLKINGEWRSNGWWFNRNVTSAAGINSNEEADLRLQADVEGQYTFTWTFANDSLDIIFPAKPEQPTLADGFYFVGTANEWTPAEGYMFSKNPDNEGEYMITATLAENDEFKAVKVENGTYSNDSWYPAAGGNYVVDAAHAGEKTIYFRPEGNTDWGGCFYIAPNGDQPIEPGELVDIILVPGVWNIDDAKFAAVTLNKVPEGTFDMTSVIAQATFSEWFVASSTIEGAYVGKIPADTKIIAFGRFAPETEIPNLEAVMSVNFWNHSDMLEIDASMKYTIDGWPAEGKDYCPGHWGDLPTVADGFYFVGSANEWTPAEGYMFSKNPDNEAEYMLTTTLAAGDEFKVVYVENGQKKDDQWYPGGDGDNYIVDAAHAGQKTIYFRPDYQGGEDWYYGCIFVPANGGEGFEEIIATDKAAKIIRNGQFFIIKGDKMYNVTGAKIR